MNRTVSSITEDAVASDDTQPVHLIRMGWETERRVATWAEDIDWNSETWTASGAMTNGIGQSGGTLVLPMDDEWITLVIDEGPRDRVIQVYEHHTIDVDTDAELLFTGTMDRMEMDEDGIQIALIEGPENKGFPPTSLGPPDYNFLIPKGKRLFWSQDTLTFE